MIEGEEASDSFFFFSLLASIAARFLETVRRFLELSRRAPSLFLFFFCLFLNFVFEKIFFCFFFVFSLFLIFFICLIFHFSLILFRCCARITESLFATSCICFGLIRVCCVLRCHVLVCAVEPPTAFPLCGHWCTVGVHGTQHQLSVLCLYCVVVARAFDNLELWSW